MIPLLLKKVCDSRMKVICIVGLQKACLVYNKLLEQQLLILSQNT